MADLNLNLSPAQEGMVSYATFNRRAAAAVQQYISYLLEGALRQMHNFIHDGTHTSMTTDAASLMLPGLRPELHHC